MGISQVSSFMFLMPVLIFAWYYLIGWLLDRWISKRSQRLRDSLCKRCNRTPPNLCGLCKFGDKRSHQPAISVTPFKEPLAFQGAADQPIQKKSIHLWADWFHEIARKTVSGTQVVRSSD
jgi:hypothetical protein